MHSFYTDSLNDAIEIKRLYQAKKFVILACIKIRLKILHNQEKSQ